MPVGYSEIGGTSFERQVLPSMPGGWKDWGVLGVGALFDAWSGAAYDHENGIFYVVGAGHRDGSNDGMFAFDVERATWSITVPPTVITQRMLSAAVKSWEDAKKGWDAFDRADPYPSREWTPGVPGAAHSYAQQQYDPDSGRVIRGVLNNWWFVDTKTKTPTKGPKLPDNEGFWPNTQSFIDRGTMYVGPSGDGNAYWTFQTLDLQRNVAGRRSYDVRPRAAADYPIGGYLLYQPGEPGVVYEWVPEKKKVFSIRLSTMQVSDLEMVDGPKDLPGLQLQTVDFDPDRGVFVIPSSDWSMLVTIDVGSKPGKAIFGSIAQKGPLPAPVGSGSYGRFRYHRERKVFVVPNKTSMNVVVLKLST